MSIIVLSTGVMSFEKALKKAKVVGKGGKGWDDAYIKNAHAGHVTIFFIDGNNKAEALSKIDQSKPYAKNINNVYYFGRESENAIKRAIELTNPNFVRREGVERKMKRSELRQLIREIIEEQYRITDRGFERPEGKGIQLVPGGSYHLGASGSPDTIIITKVTPERFWYRHYPYEKDQVIQTNIGKDLIKSGMENWLKSGYPKHHPKRAKAYKQTLAGGKPLIVKLGDYQYWNVKLKGDPGVDVYGVAKAYGVAKDWNDKENTATAEVMKQYIPAIKKIKGIKILSQKKR